MTPSKSEGASSESVGADRWADAIKTTRESTKWGAGAIGAIGVAIFGGIPALKGLGFEWGDPADNAQMWLAFASAIVGLAGVVFTIVLLIRATLPIYSSLSRLSLETKRQLRDAAPGELLPRQYPTVALLQKEILLRERAVTFTASQEAGATGTKKAAAAKAHGDAVAFLEDLRAWATRIVNFDVFTQTQRRLVGPSTIAAICAASLGATVFMFATSKPPTAEADPAGSSSEVGGVAYLEPIDEDAWAEIASVAVVDDCADSEGRYLVLVTGLSEDVYTVRTLPRTDTCQAWEFEVHRDVADVHVLAKPQKVEVTFTPLPATSD